jgi:hypothetical protein
MVRREQAQRDEANQHDNTQGVGRGTASAVAQRGKPQPEQCLSECDNTTVKNYLARDPAQDSLTYTWDSNLNAVYGMAALDDATYTDLRPFKNSNAKLIL